MLSKHIRTKYLSFRSFFYSLINVLKNLQPLTIDFTHLKLTCHIKFSYESSQLPTSLFPKQPTVLGYHRIWGQSFHS